MNTKPVCFIIGPIGEAGTVVRKHADELFEFVLEPITSDLSLTISRSDRIGAPGMISQQIIDKLIDSEIVIADLSFHNPNAFYELAIRHTMKSKPTIHICRRQDRIPFDLQDHRTIFFDLSDLTSVNSFTTELRTQLREVLDHPKAEYFNPLATALAIKSLKLSDAAGDLTLAKAFEDIGAIRKALSVFEEASRLLGKANDSEGGAEENQLAYHETKEISDGLREYIEYYDNGGFIKRFGVLIDPEKRTYRRSVRNFKTLNEARAFDPFVPFPL